MGRTIKRVARISLIVLMIYFLLFGVLTHMAECTVMEGSERSGRFVWGSRNVWANTLHLVVFYPIIRPLECAGAWEYLRVPPVEGEFVGAPVILLVLLEKCL